MRCMPWGSFALPARRHDHETARSGARCAFAGGCKDVRPHIEHRQEVVAALRVGNGDHPRLLGKVEPGDRVEGVEVRPHDIAKVGGRELPDVGEGIHRAAADGLPGFDVGGLTAGGIHRDEGVEIQKRLDADLVTFLRRTCVKVFIGPRPMTFPASMLVA